MQGACRGLTAAFLALVFTLAADNAVRAGLYQYDPSRSGISIAVGNLPPLSLQRLNDPNGASLSLGISSKTLTVQAGQFTTTSASVRALAGQTALLTGVPVLTRLTGTVNNGTGAFTETIGTASTMWQGAMGLTGWLAVRVAGMTTTVSLPSLSSLSGFTPRSSVVLTGITTPLVSTTMSHRRGALITLQPSSMQSVVPVTGPTSVTHTVTFYGSSDIVTTTGGGMLAQFTMVKPIRVTVGSSTLPGVVNATFTFVPEPSTMLLGLTSVSTLALMGWRRRRRRS